MDKVYRIRRGLPKDLPSILELIKELAEYEKALDQVETSVESMTVDGFGEHSIFDFFVAESKTSKTIVGLSLFYFRYSTWKGKRLYLEDLIVTESARGLGVGKSLMDQTVSYAKETQCTGMMWQALNWNSSALRFYEVYGASFDDEWVNCHLDFSK